MGSIGLEKETREELLEKYEQERNKRLNRERVTQYTDVRSEALQAMNKDPWVDYNDTRVKNPPLKDGDNIKVLIIGAGLAGVVFGGRLIESGISNKDLVCVDAAGGFGGTWYFNRYPGVMCDVEGYCYVPFLEETGYQTKHRYSYGQEIRKQIERSADHFGVQGQFCTRVDSKIWDEEKKLWIVTMTRTIGEPSTSESFTVAAEFVILSSGPFPFPKVPQLPGWNDFTKRNHVFHSARWDYNYTGGSQENPELVKLQGKRVALVGTGSTAIQIVPELARWAEHVYVVQRTPSYVGARNQTETNPEFWAEMTKEKGWQNKRRTVFDAYVSNSKGYGPDVIDDGWTNTPAGSGFLGSSSRLVARDQVEEHIRDLHELDFPRTTLLRQRVDEIVKDKATAGKLKAYYGSWCKRPSFHDEYLEAFNKSNVTLVDTDGKGLDGLTESGILSNGIEYKIDALILATGFTFGLALDPSERLGATIKGREGLNMKDYWHRADSGTLLGVALPGFPNVFSYFGRGTGGSWNFMSNLEAQATLVASILKQAQKRAEPGQRVVIEASEEGERQWGVEVAKRATWYSSMAACTPGFLNGEGAATLQGNKPKTEEQLLNEGKKMGWGGGPLDYQELLGDYATKEDLKGFTVEVVA